MKISLILRFHCKENNGACFISFLHHFSSNLDLNLSHHQSKIKCYLVQEGGMELNPLCSEVFIFVHCCFIPYSIQNQIVIKVCQHLPLMRWSSFKTSKGTNFTNFAVHPKACKKDIIGKVLSCLRCKPPSIGSIQCEIKI